MIIELKNRQFIDLEEPIKAIAEQIENLRSVNETSNIDISDTIQSLENKIEEERKRITDNLTRWQRVELSRHPDRPYTKQYIEHIFTNFVELHGDRNFADDKAVIGGLAQLNKQTVIVIGQQKGYTLEKRQLRNFGMMYPEGYRKALRLMKLAEKFNKPIISFIDTPGAYPGVEAEERGQGEAIARNIYEMIRLKVPVICVVIGEGASGGALGVGIGDKIYMQENTWYTVIAPESCSTILWKTWEKKEEAAEQLKLTAKDMLDFKLIDGIIKEPLGGAQWNYVEAAEKVKQTIKGSLKELLEKTPKERIQERIEKFQKMGFYNE
ncbi:MAG: acetyl-CoA carboxylase carboxyltransferase subunit alpha [Chitinophagaceae bacterium]